MKMRMCPHCGYEVDAAASIGVTATPEPGDFMLCLDCGGWGIETDDSLIRLPSEEEQADIDREPACIAAWQAWERSQAGRQRLAKVRSAH